MSLRTPAILDKYVLAKKSAPPGCALCRAKEIGVIQDFKYWTIVPNEFPYDRIAKVNDLLILKRHATIMEISAEEEAELLLIKSTVLPQLPYSTLYENLPRQQSIKGHYHIHLIVLLDEYSDIPE